MELKEAILSTLAEMQEDGPTSGNVIKAEELNESAGTVNDTKRIEPPAAQFHNLSSAVADTNEMIETMIKKEASLTAQDSTESAEDIQQPDVEKRHVDSQSDIKFLEGLRERILVMFEGMQSPNNRAAEAKIDLILNFLEWQLSLIDERLENKK